MNKKEQICQAGKSSDLNTIYFSGVPVFLFRHFLSIGLFLTVQEIVIHSFLNHFAYLTGIFHREKHYC